MNAKKIRKAGVAVHVGQRQVIHFKAVRKVAHTNPVIKSCANHDDFVASFSQALGNIEHVNFHPTQVWNEKIRDQGDVQLIMGLQSLCVLRQAFYRLRINGLSLRQISLVDFR
jgi:hypothetical protein